MKQKLHGLFDGCMRGRTLYAVPICMGPLGSPLSAVGVQVRPCAVWNVCLPDLGAAPPRHCSACSAGESELLLLALILEVVEAILHYLEPLPLEVVGVGVLT